MADNSSYFTSDPSPPGSRSAASPPERDLLKGRGTDPDQPPEGEVTTARAGRSTTARATSREPAAPRTPMAPATPRGSSSPSNSRKSTTTRTRPGHSARSAATPAGRPRTLRSSPALPPSPPPLLPAAPGLGLGVTPLSHLDDHPGILQQKAPRPNLY